MLQKVNLHRLILVLMPFLFIFNSCTNQTDELLINSENDVCMNSVLLRKNNLI